MRKIILSFSLALIGMAHAQSFYDMNQINVIEITFSDPNWDQTLDSYYAAGLDQRLIGSCTINGVPFDSVGVKYKGNSSYSPNNPKNPLNIKLDYVKNQDYEGYETIKLGNGFRDPSFVREALSYEIARKYMIAPHCNFSKVYINGNYYGLFANQESINKDFIEKYFNSNKNNTLFKCNPNYGSGSSSLEYLGTDSSLYFNSYELQSDFGWNDMVYFTYSLSNSFSTVEQFLDIDRAIWMLAFDNVLVNLDSYIGPLKQNYYLYKDDNARMNTVVWDLNQSFGSFSMINGGGPGQPPTTISDLQQLDPLLRQTDNTYPLSYQILNNPRYLKMYIAHCRTILEENFSNNWYLLRADSIQNIIYNDLQADANKFYSMTEFTNNLYNSVGTGPQSVVGINQLMNSRINYLQSHSEYVKTPPTIDTIITGNASPYSTVNFNVSVTNANYVYLGHRNSFKEPFTKTQMFDDGAHNDGAAGDGVYGASITVQASNVQYYVYAENNDAGIFSPVRAEYEFYELPVVGDIVINELSASNSFIVADQNGEYDDWIELYNNSSNNIDISGYHLSDNGGNLTAWTFPTSTIIPANDYLIVWADKDTTQTGLHANFKLSAAGETLYLTDPSGAILDEITFPTQTTDVTYGRYPNGTGAFIYMSPTFNAENVNYQVGIENMMDEYFELKLYPNPANHQISILFNDLENHSVAIYNIMGENVLSINVNQKTTIDISNWSSGVYILKTGTFSTKFIKVD